MKAKLWLLTLLFSGILLLCCRAFSEEAKDITRNCRIIPGDGREQADRLTDDNPYTFWHYLGEGNGFLTAEAFSGRKIAHVTIRFTQAPGAWCLQIPDENGNWLTVYEDRHAFLHAFGSLPVPSGTVRLASLDPAMLEISEIRFYTEGELPPSVQVWEDAPEKADILFLAAHADDELIFFGGAIPVYTAQMQKAVAVAYLTDCGLERRTELLNGLWSMGVRNYPILGPFPDQYKKSLEEAYEYMGGEKAVNDWIITLFRRYRPEVVVTHDIGGEYGHFQHIAAARGALAAFDQSADEAACPDSAAVWGPWQVKKLYLHLWPENRIRLDWSNPLSSLNGLTGLEAADRAFRFHRSQQNSRMSVRSTGADYDNTLFGLARSTVGPDEEGGDFLEHIHTSSN